MKRIIGIVTALTLFLSLGINARAKEIEDAPTTIIIYSEIIGEKYNVCPELLQSIAYHESRFNANAKNGNCIGLMQVNGKVHKERLAGYGWTEKDLTSIYRNMTVAADYLSELFDEYEDVGLVLAYYQGNTKAVKNFKKSGKLSDYTKAVLDRSYAYEELHGKH